MHRQIGLAAAHGGRRAPVGPFPLHADAVAPGPGETVPPDTNAVAIGLAVFENEIERALGIADDDRAGRLPRLEIHNATRFRSRDIARDMPVEVMHAGLN